MHRAMSVGRYPVRRAISGAYRTSYESTRKLVLSRGWKHSKSRAAQAHKITRQCNIALPCQTGNLITRPTRFVPLLLFSFFFSTLFSTREALVISLRRRKMPTPRTGSDRWTMASRILQGAFTTRRSPQITRNRQFKEATRNSTEYSNLLGYVPRNVIWRMRILAESGS